VGVAHTTGELGEAWSNRMPHHLMLHHELNQEAFFIEPLDKGFASNPPTQ